MVVCSMYTNLCLAMSLLLLEELGGILHVLVIGEAGEERGGDYEGSGYQTH